MGKPYATELSELSRTYDWARTVELPPAVVRFPETTAPLVAIGSGGSLTVAEFAACLHREIRNRVAVATTPLEVLNTGLNLREVAILLTSAGGRHPDVLGILENAAAREPNSFLVICLRKDSPLSARALRFSNVDFVDFAPPVEKDGFLATNSSLALVVLLLRAYSRVFKDSPELPKRWKSLVPERRTQSLNERMNEAWARNTLVVLYGPSTRVAAIDLESRLTEAALQNVWIADYRNFAHGRHHWLAKHPQSTAVLALVTPEDERLASATIGLIPSSIPVIREDIPFSGPIGTIAALGRVINLTAGAGLKREIDPGRPGVPPFGRRLYHLNAFGRRQLPAPDQLAIERKTGKSIARLSSEGSLTRWRDAYQDFRRRLHSTRFHCLAFDYDGTLCGETDRFGQLGAPVVSQLIRLLEGGIDLGVATGRGKSVREALRKAIPNQYWSRVIVGYYNGGEIGLLSDERPDGNPTAGPALASVARVLMADPSLKRLAKISPRPPQITIEPVRPVDADDVWALVEETVGTLRVPGISVVRSSHSVDIVGPDSDKRFVIERLRQIRTVKESAILCIGDKGRYPGNDHSLLAHRPSLSVDECSTDPDTCWNLTAAGSRRVAGSLQYLEAMTLSRYGAHLSGLSRRQGR